MEKPLQTTGRGMSRLRLFSRQGAGLCQYIVCPCGGVADSCRSIVIPCRYILLLFCISSEFDEEIVVFIVHGNSKEFSFELVLIPALLSKLFHADE